MNADRVDELRQSYRQGLLDDTTPFWLRHGLDREHGGILTCLGRDGTVIDTDKGVWQQGRFAWLMATLYHDVEQRREWLDAARSAVQFLRRHGFDADGRMFFQLTRDGRPVRKRRYVFSEAFAAIGFAAYARASGDEQVAGEALGLFEKLVRYLTEPGLLEPKVNPQVRPMKGLVGPMILLSTAQVLRETLDAPHANVVIDDCVEEIRRDFMKPDLEAVMETVGPQGELIDHFDGRLLNPGHAIEAAWFILHESVDRGGDADLLRTGLSILDWMWHRGWDEEYGGLFYFRDVKGLPVTEYWHDMKFWWPHNEAIIATLLAYHLTGDEKYARWHTLVHDWAYAHFPDAEHGEWFGYLHRDGRLSVELKGNLWKGAFHLPRMQWMGWRIAEQLAKSHEIDPAQP